MLFVHGVLLVIDMGICPQIKFIVTILSKVILIVIHVFKRIKAVKYFCFHPVHN